MDGGGISLLPSLKHAQTAILAYLQKKPAEALGLNRLVENYNWLFACQIAHMREQQHVADGRRIGQQHDQTVDADS